MSPPSRAKRAPKPSPPASPRTLDAYLRVSQVRGREGESFISFDVQRDRIAAWAVAHGHRIAKVHEEPNRSGSTVDRPKLNEVMRRIEAGETGGVVVFKLDRFGRTLIDSLGLIERIERAGGTFASVSDGFDLSTETGRLVLRIMLSLAEFELERIRGNWREARERAVGRGVHVTALVPFGYQRRDQARDGNGRMVDSRLEPHPVNGPIVTELFERRAAGAGWSDMRRFLESKNAKTGRGRTVWSLRAMRDIMRNDVYLGVASHGEYQLEGAHEPLTDPVTWRRAQRHGKQTKSRAAEPALLSGLLRCAGCRYIMRAVTRQLADGRIVHDYRCRCQAESAGRCPESATATGTDGIAEFVVEAFFERIEDVRANPSANGRRLTELQAGRDAARQARDEYAADDRVQQVVGMDAYVRGLEARQHALEAAQAAVDAEHDRVDALPLPDDVGSLRADWPTLSIDERRGLLALAIDCVFVRRRQGRQPITDRTFICWRGEAPELPSPGKRGYTPLPFLFPDPSDAGVAASQDREVSGSDGVAKLAV